MITEIELENVRLFEGKGWVFPIRPLEVFCGTNSAGKSTLLKVLLLLRQSIIAPESYGEFEGRLRFVSSQLDLGNYLSFVSNNDGSKDLKISLTIQDMMRQSFVDTFTSSSPTTLSKRTAAPNPWLPYFAKATFTFGMQSGNRDLRAQETQAPHGPASGPRSQGYLKSAQFEVRQADKILLTWKVISSLAKSGEEKNVERYELLVPSDFASKALSQIESLGIDEKFKLERFQVTMRGLLPNGLRAPLKTRKAKRSTKDIYNWPLPAQIHFILGDFRLALQAIHYLGPLRTPAKRFYITNLDDTPDLDSTGEFLPSILHQKGETKVLGVSQAYELSTLESGLNIWLYFLRTGERASTSQDLNEIQLSTTKDVLVELLLMTPSGSKKYALADSGFGYSQILPILVRGLLAEKGSTIVIEQPELHLNPALQVRLAHFFIELTRADRKSVV